MNPLSSTIPASTRFQLKVLGILILLVGLGFAGSVWRAQDRIERQASAREASEPGYSQFAEPLPPDDSRRYSHEVELYYGKTGLLLDKCARALGALTHGKPLAVTIALASGLIAGGLFLVAAKAPSPAPPRS